MEYIGFFLFLLLALTGIWGILNSYDGQEEECNRSSGARIGDGHVKYPQYTSGQGTTRAARKKKRRKKNFKKSYPIDCWRRKYKRKRGRA